MLKPINFIKSNLLKSINFKKTQLIRVNRKFSNNINLKEKEGYYVTTPIYYVNAVPHIGHLYSSVIADTLARYYRDLDPKTPVLLTTGTDEHGLKIHSSALKTDLSTQQFCDKVSLTFLNLTKSFNLIENLKFMRTTDVKHKEMVKIIWNKLMKNGLIYKDEYKGWYATSDEAFYKDDEVYSKLNEVDNKVERFAKVSNSKVEWTCELTYKFKLSKFRRPLIDWLKSNPQVILPLSRRNEVMMMLDGELDDLSISRPYTRVPWGISVPNDPDQTIYVWLDALCNYLTATGLPTTESESEHLFPPDVQIVGKDILKFHAIYWPAFLMGAELPLPKCILAHGHWTQDGTKMSKSKGNVTDPMKLLNKFGSDAIRYYLLRDGGSFSDDCDFSTKTLMIKYKKELAGMLGNSVNRLTSPNLNPLQKSFKIDLINPHSTSLNLIEDIQSIGDKFDFAIKNYQLGKAVALLNDLTTKVNVYLQNQEPWKRIPINDDIDNINNDIDNSLDDHKSLAPYNEVIGLSLEAIKAVAILSQPIMPSISKLILDQFNLSINNRTLIHTKINQGWNENRCLNTNLENKVLFPKLE